MGQTPHTARGTDPSTGAGSDGGAAGGAGVLADGHAGAEEAGPCQAQLGGGRLPASLGGPQHPSWAGGVGGHPQRPEESSPGSGMCVSLRNPSLSRGWCSWSPQPEHPLELPNPCSPTAVKTGQKLRQEPLQQKEKKEKPEAERLVHRQQENKPGSHNSPRFVFTSRRVGSRWRAEGRRPPRDPARFWV